MNRIIRAIVLCAVYLTFTFLLKNTDRFYPKVQEYFLMTVLFLIPTLFIIIFFFFIKGLYDIYRQRKYLTLLFCVPTFIYATVLIDSIFDPYHNLEDVIGSKIVMRACYEGTMNTAKMKFRADGKFKVHWTAVFGYDEWDYGSWEQKGDTIFLKCDDKKNDRLSNKLVIYKDHLVPIELCNDSLNDDIVLHQFYLGECKGLN